MDQDYNSLDDNMQHFVLPEGALFNVQPAYDLLVPEIEALAQKLQAAGVQFVMGFCYSHEHPEEGVCRHGTGQRIYATGHRASLEMQFAAEILLGEADHQPAVVAAVKGYTVVRNIIDKEANGTLQQEIGEALERQQKYQADHDAAQYN